MARRPAARAHGGERLFAAGRGRGIVRLGRSWPEVGVVAERLSARQRQILEFIRRRLRERGYPPSVREIGDAV
ncbi:MAG: repressor LexA, partial [Clostridia bacterium]|nr:repressor LexA [Clostridia bacterium]